MQPLPFHEHRRRYLQALGQDFAIIFAPPPCLRNADTEYRYRTSSSFYHLTGWTQPQAAALFRPGTAEPFTMFVQPRNPEQEVWTGVRPGPEGAKAEFGADAAHTIDELPALLPELLRGAQALHYSPGAHPEQDALVFRALAGARRQSNREGGLAPYTLVDHALCLEELRLVKTGAELRRLREAAQIGVEAMNAAMTGAAPGRWEYEIEAILEGTFRRRGGKAPSFPSIVASGANATVLHYIDNQRQLPEGGLLLVDAGCEFDFHASDITRTFPVSGRFSAPQRDIYEVVLRAQEKAISLVKPGLPFNEVHEAALGELVDGMLALGLLTGTRDEILETGAYKRFYPHRSGHWLGMDVHDVGRYVKDGEQRRLLPGMVFTVEPGLYVPPGDEEASEVFRGIGVRIEDDILVTEEGYENLTAGCPKAPEDVEAACGATS